MAPTFIPRNGAADKPSIPKSPVFSPKRQFSNMECPREEMKGNSELQQQPWLLITQRRRNYCYLQNGMFYDVVGEIPEIVGRTPYCSYGEWVVLGGRHYHDLLINLLSKETIQLPVMKFSSDLSILTSPPSDPTCHLVYFSYDDEESLSLIIWQPGDKEFTIKKWDCEIIPDQVRACAVMAGELCLNILSRDGESVLVMVEFKESTYQFEVVHMDEGEIEFMNSSYDLRFFEYSGELFAVYKIKCGGDSSNVAGFKIFKADLLNKKWIRIKNLGGLAIFIGCSTLQTHCAAVDSGIAGNSIYFLEFNYYHDRDSYYVYNLEEGAVRMQPIFCSVENARVDWIMMQGDPNPPFLKLLKEDQEIEVENGEVEQDEVQESWNMVPYELLNLIQLRLFGRDYAVFPGVCKAWKQASIQLKQTSIQDYSLLSSATLLEQCQSSSPLLMYQEDITSSYDSGPIFRFFDPVHRMLYRTRIPELKEVDIQYSRDGWLLVLRSSDQSVFFFNPLTQEKIELPRMPPHESYKDFLSFSSPPTCSNCLVVGMQYYQDTIYTLKHGDETWRKYDLNYVMRDWCTVVMLDGLHYFLYEDRHMVVLNLNGAEGQEEEVLDSECWLPKLGRSKSVFKEDFFLEIDGAVAFVTVQPNGGGISIFKWNDLKTDWELMEGGAEFGGKQMFLSRRGSFMEKMDDIGGLGNTIFLPMIDDAKAGVFYSLATGKYHTFYTGYSSELPYNVDKFLDGIWVKPDRKIVGQKNLKWFIS